jgi:hypothetical protein
MTGTKIAEFDSEEKARVAMREQNTMYGYVGVTKLHYQNGIEMETTRKGIAPYGITEFDRWNLKFNPSNQVLPNKDTVDLRYD